MSARNDTATMRDRLGCLSVSGGALAAVVVAVIVAWTLLGGPALFSPGALNAVSKSRTLGGVTSHAQLSNCDACHPAPWSSQTMADRCLGCHTDVLAQVDGARGLHGHIVGGSVSPTCRGCHPDHRGASAALTVTDASFPHELTSYSLVGHRRTAKGAQVTCSDCHPHGLTAFDQATCYDCHTKLNAGFMSPHVVTFGRQCVPCHDGSGQFGSDFDHSKLPFKLTGKHVTLACGRCHTNTASAQAMHDTPSECISCHASVDKHKGSFGRLCGQCHTADGWANANFNHAIFPVDHGSREQKPTCQTCHPNDVSTYTCFGCHRHSPASVTQQHEGRAAASLTDCIRCHSGNRRGNGGQGGD